MRGFATTAGQYALRGEKAMDILGLGFLPHQDDLHAECPAQVLRAVGIENGLPDGCTG